jgi:DNA-directed RNA polymerase subunit K/omega
MTEKVDTKNKFELVVLAGARAHQLIRGCTPRAQGPVKVARVATLEIKQGHIQKLEPHE